MQTGAEGAVSDGGADPAAADPHRAWRRAVALTVLAFALYLAVKTYLDTLFDNSGIHQVADWLISYPGEFIRRGLFGEVLLRLTPGGSGTLWILFAVLITAYGLILSFILGFLRRMAWSWSAIALACSPAGLAFVGWDPNGGFRKEILGFAALVLLAFARKEGDRLRRYALRAGALAIWTLAIFSWEALAVMLPAAVFLLVAGRSTAAGRWWAGAFGAVTVVGVLASVLFRGDPTTPPALCQEVRDDGLSSQLCRGSIEWMGRGLDESTRALHQAIGADSAYLLLVPLAALPIAFSPWLRVYWRWALLMMAAAVPLFFLGIDYGRWLHVMFVELSICLMVAPSRLIQSRQWTALATILYVALWGIPHAGPYQSDEPGWPFVGMLAAAIDQLQSLVFT